MRKLTFTRKKVKKKYILRALCWIAVFLYMLGMFYFSGQSGTQSNKISKEIVTEINQHVSIPSVLAKRNFLKRLDYNFILRKLTHFTEYFVLALIIYLAFRICLIGTKTARFITFGFCILYAAFDEFHQSFVIERTPALRDIIIDVSGGALALIILFFIRSIRLRTRRAN